MIDAVEVVKEVSAELEQTATRRARDRAKASKWDLDVATFLFAVLIIIILLLFQGIGTEIVAPIAIFGLAMVWLVGWRHEKQLYQRFYNEELSKLQPGSEKTTEETVAERIQLALRQKSRYREKALTLPPPIGFNQSC